MGAERWEQAAASIQRYLNVTPEDSQNEEAALVSLRRSRDTLQGVAVNKCEEAVAAGNQEEVERFCKIMARIEMGEKGVERYAAFLAGRVESAAAAEVSKLRSALALGAPSSSTPFFAQGLTTVLEVVAKAISDGEAVIAEGFGEDARVKLVLAVYDRAAPAIADALELAYAGRNVRALVRKHRDHGEHQQHQPGGAATKEALELDRALQEVSLCLQRLEQFTWFLTARLGAGGALPRVAAIDVKRSELISGYIPLEEAFITYSVEKAIRNADRDEDSRVSAMVDEVFFILKKCARRALATSSLNAMGHVIMYCHTVLVSTYKDALEALLAATDKSGALELSGGFASLFAGTTVGGQVADLSRRQVVDSFDGTGYNNMEASAANVLKLHGALEQELQQVFKGSARKDEEKAREVMAELATAHQALGKALGDALTRLAAVLARFLRPALATFESIDFDEVESAIAESPAAQELVASLEATLQPLAEELSQGCLDTLVLVLISEHIAPALERLALGKNAAAFSPVGAMLLDKDVRAVVAFLAGLTHRTVRDPFARLSQIALVLNLGEPNEIFDYNWGEAGSPIAWRLTADEVRKVMLRRVDFRPERVQALRL